MEDKIINLSFDDNSIKVCRYKERTIVNLVSYFRTDKLVKFMKEFGYDTLPCVVLNTLKSYGYTYDYKLGGWMTKTTGVTSLDKRDEDVQEKANHIAMTKAKVKAYDRATRCLGKIKVALANAMILFDNSEFAFSHYLDAEKKALDRVIETGYCNPDKK